MLDAFVNLLSAGFQRGGWVMYPLLAISIAALAIIFERCWFWAMTNGPGRRAWLARLAEAIRAGRTDAARAMVEGDRSIYARVVQRLLELGPTDDVATEIVEAQRPRLERFMPTLGTIITAAPMLGILGTVSGIIASFQVLSAEGMVTDPEAVGAGIAEALLTTVVGLAIALIVLFPFNAFRAQTERTLGRLEALIATMKGRDEGAEGRRDEGEAEARRHEGTQAQR
jgi:biopolymer transport protein ExbB